MARLNNHVSWWRKEMVRTNNDELTLGAFVITFAIVILGILWYKKTTWSPSNGALSLPPGPKSLPIVWYLPFLSPDLHRQFTDMAQTYGPIFKIYLGSKLYIVISNPELAKVVFRDQDENFSNRNAVIATSIVSYGALSEGMKLEKPSRMLLAKIGKYQQYREFLLTEANVLTSMAWGNSSLEEAKDGHIVAELHMAVSKIFELMGKPNASDFIPSLAWLDLQGVVRDMKREFQRMDQIFTLFINDRIKSNSKRSKDAVRHGRKKDLLQILLELNDQKEATSLSITQIKALLMIRTDTTTTLIEWAMTEILKNHSIMKKIQEELENVVGVNNMVEESHLPQLKYLDATIRETFRLHPVVPLGLPRSPNKTCTVGGYTIPKGNNMKFLPFGSGRRLCPGYPLAEKMQMYILASLLHSFNWTLPNGEEHNLFEKFGITLRKTNPLIVIPSQRLSDVSLYM
ncbi:cytochrome P450 [Tanacetum coccineum]|uniref:Cytochrome P450 n=1 Tax=Tanacetum coccineum TaxID=301880 RepID=A0ABQ4ZKT9_9ASTR